MPDYSSEFHIGQRVYFMYPPSGAQQRWYGVIIDYDWDRLEDTWVYKIKFEGINTPQMYSNYPYKMIWAVEQTFPLDKPEWEL
jgi:hypothetical protein